MTTLTATAATVQAIRALRERATDVASLQEIHLGDPGAAGDRPPVSSPRVSDGARGPAAPHGAK